MALCLGHPWWDAEALGQFEAQAFEEQRLGSVGPHDAAIAAMRRGAGERPDTQLP
ncbi:MAG: hypothetical protein AAB290_01915 [Candidatus Eisenbacteria bacterium]